MCSERPGYNDKILLMQAFGPLAFMGNVSSKLGRELATFMARSSVSFIYLPSFFLAEN